MEWKRISIHNLVYLDLDPKSPWYLSQRSILGDLPGLLIDEERPTELDKKNIPHVQVSHSDKLMTIGLRELGDGVLIGTERFVDSQYRVSFEHPAKKNYRLVCDGEGIEWIIWTLQLALLVNHATFVHAAGVEKNNQAILFPSWGGVGKTALVKKLVDDFGWNLLGDDLIILSSDGVCYGFPKPFVIYPYHKDVFPDFFSSGGGPIAPAILNDTLSDVARFIKPYLRLFPRALNLARHYNPQSVRVNPSKIFGAGKFARQGQLRKIIWLDRINDLESVKISVSNYSLVSRLIGSTIHEFDHRCSSITNVAMGLGLLSHEEYLTSWINVLQMANKDSESWIMYIPAEIPVGETPDVITNILVESGIIQ